MQSLKDGCSRGDACILSGIAHQTLRNEEERDPEFAGQVAAAEIVGKAGRLSRLYKAGNDDWRADAWFLERKYHEEFGRRSPEQLSLAAVLAIVSPVFAEMLSHIPEEHRSLVADRVELMVEKLQLESKKK